MGHRSQSIGIDELYAEWDKLIHKDPVGPGWIKISALAKHWGVAMETARQRIGKYVDMGKAELTTGKQGHYWVKLK